MTMSASTLSGELNSRLVGNLSAKDAAEKWAESYGEYIAEAIAGPSPPLPVLSTSAPIVAMTFDVSFTSSSTALSAAAEIMSGVSEYWDTMIASPATYFASAVSITPPPGISAAIASLSSVFSSNINLSRSDSFDAIAAVIHDASQKAIVTLSGPILLTVA